MHTCGTPGVLACSNPERAISWDGIHFTEAAYKIISQFIINKAQYTQPPFSDMMKISDNGLCDAASHQGTLWECFVMAVYMYSGVKYVKSLVMAFVMQPPVNILYSLLICILNWMSNLNRTFEFESLFLSFVFQWRIFYNNNIFNCILVFRNKKLL